jgi:hypothetical protein
MHHPALSLLSLQDRSRGVHDDREQAGQRAMAAFGLAGTLSIAMLLAGLPLVSMGIVAVATTVFVVATKASAAARALRSAALPPPEAIVAFDLREVYRAILALYGEIERGIACTRRLRSAIDPMLERCMAAVEMCGRMALLSNPLEHHLDAHDPRALRVEIERLGARCAATTDEDAVRVLRAAIAARTRELANLEQMTVMRERIIARLELCRATLAAFAATIMKLHIADEEQAAVATGSVTDHLDTVAEKLEILETVLGVEPEIVTALPPASSAAEPAAVSATPSETSPASTAPCVSAIPPASAAASAPEIPRASAPSSAPEPPAASATAAASAVSSASAAPPAT